MMISTQRLRHVAILADHMHFGNAAKALHITQPALSRSIQGLEASLGVRLFERGSTGLDLTVFGEVVVRHARGVLRGLANLQRDVDLLNGHDIGEVNVGGGPIVAAGMLGAALGNLNRARPNIKITLQVGSWDAMREPLLDDAIDLFVGESEDALSDTTFDVTALRPRAICFFARAGHPLALRAGLSLDDMRPYPLASPRIPMRIETLLRGRQAGAAWWGEFSHAPPAIECENYSVLKNVVQASDALSAAPVSVIEKELASGTLARLRVDMPAMQTRFGIVTRAGRSSSPASETFVRHLLALDERSKDELE